MSLTISSKLPHTLGTIFLLWNLVLSQSHCCLCPTQVLGVFSLSPQGMAPREVLLPPHFHIQTILLLLPKTTPTPAVVYTPSSYITPLLYLSSSHLWSSATLFLLFHRVSSWLCVIQTAAPFMIFKWFFYQPPWSSTIPVSQVHDFHSFSHLAFIILHQPFPLVVVLHSL